MKMRFREIREVKEIRKEDKEKNIKMIKPETDITVEEARAFVIGLFTNNYPAETNLKGLD